ncbi:helix-hairpin-helix domain-containing protein [Peptoniphilus sp. HCN-40583]|uniref:helix-hairpin-helix domain-containing protein n=1 Tax=Peptoniphilus sp. HCN-40583 TaxID=3134662 RepID=UPI0030BBC3B5
MKLTDREKILAFASLCLLVLTVSYYHYRLKAAGAEEPSFVIENGDVAKSDFKETQPAEEEGIGSAIYVDIGGAVKNPGLYELEKGARVKDGITAAGGIVGNADTSQINLAKKLNDEEKLYIPKAGEQAPVVATGGPSPAQTGPVSIQNGSKEDLMRLPGIGEKTADKIIEYRTAHPFTALEDLKEVPGIGEKTFESLKNNIQL